MRGKDIDKLLNMGGERITPACAGKSYYGPASGVETGDHPRVCGEKFWNLQENSSVPGSPPRVRGKVSIQPLPPVCHRITPACAGKSLLLSFPYAIQQDHPRVCGEKECFLRFWRTL